MFRKGQRYSVKYLFVCLLAVVMAIALSACPQDEPKTTPTPTPSSPESTKATVIQGKVVNDADPSRPMEGLEIAALSGSVELASGNVNPKTGEYSITVPKPGSYDIRLKSPVGAVTFNYGVEAKAGQTSRAPDIPLPADALPPAPPEPDDAPPTTATTPPDQPDAHLEAASVQGTVYPRDAEVVVLDGDKVVAKAKAENGNFTVQNVQPGLYTVEISAAGHNTVKIENVPVSAQGATVSLNELLLYRSPLDGVDYDKGVIVATGVGKPNPNMPAPQASIMACRAAKMIAYRNLLDTLLGLKLGEQKSVRDLDSDGKVSTELQGFVRGARVVKEEKREDGSCEVTLEVPINGAAGVTKYLRKIIKK